VVKHFIIQAGKDKQRRAHSLTEHSRRLEKNEGKIRSLGEKMEDVYSKTNAVIM